MKKPILLFLFPYKVLDKTIEVNEISHFKKYIDTEIWDLSLVTTKKFQDKISATPSDIKEIKYFHNYKQFYCNLIDLVKNSKIDNIYIANDITYSTLRQFICLTIMNLVLPNERTFVFDLQIIGLPIHTINKERGTFSRAKNLIITITSISELFNRIVSIILRFIWIKIDAITTHRVVAGDYWIKIENNNIDSKRLKLIYAHTQDFSSYIIKKNSLISNPTDAFGIFINSAGPYNTSDSYFKKRKDSRKIENWYPSLNKFLKKIEDDFNIKMKVALHYKSTLENYDGLFNGRQLFLKNTIQNIYSSEIVIAISSTAISFGVIFHKPIVLIYSNELSKDMITMNLIKNISNQLNLSTVNIDDINLPNLINLKTSIDQEKYELFIKNYLSSDPLMRPNYEIILNDIIGINFN
jgi:hypothetical protein